MQQHNPNGGMVMNGRPGGPPAISSKLKKAPIPSLMDAGSSSSSSATAAAAAVDNNNTIKASQAAAAAAAAMNDFKTKTVLKEAVDAVVSSFAKHSQGYGRGKNPWFYLNK
jgi:hypothetical protein